MDSAELSKKELILNCDQYFECLFKDIKNARHSIHFETYIFEDDAIGKKIASAFAKAATRGVKVRLLLDGIGSPYLSNATLNLMESAGVEIRIFHPLPWKRWQLNRAYLRRSLLSKIIYLFSAINSRTHRKMCIIDDDIIYIGSANVSQTYLSKEKNGEGWSECIVRIVGVNPKELQFAFDIAWHALPHPTIQAARKKIDITSPFRLNYSRRLRRLLYKSLLRRIATANERVWVTMAYFNPDYYLLKNLIAIAKRGVDVKIILPYKSDSAIMSLVATTFYYKLIKGGVGIFEYLPTVLHSKILIIDNWFSVGSSNLNHRSLRHDLEVDAIIQTEEAKKKLEKEFLEKIQSSKKVSLADLKKQSIFSQVFSQLLLFIKYYF